MSERRMSARREDPQSSEVDDNDERRNDVRRGSSDDRRKIPRFTNAELNRTLAQTKSWIYLLYATSIVVAVFELGYSLSSGMENLTQGFFFGTVFIILAILLWRVIYTIKLFLTNHSILNLQRIHEQFSALFAYVAVLSIIFYVASFFLQVLEPDQASFKAVVNSSFYRPEFVRTVNLICRLTNANTKFIIFCVSN